MNDLPQSKKPRILLCWGYHRKGWVHAFNTLQNDFEFYYLFYITKPDNEINYSQSSTLLYWKDFSSAQNIIEKIKPDKIVMMGTEGIHTTALNIVAKKKNIETFVLQHGVYPPYSDCLNFARNEMEERNRVKQFKRSELEVDRLFLLRFFLCSLIFVQPLAIIYMLKLQYLKRKFTEIEALTKIPSEFRIPNKYVVFSKKQSSFYTVRDRIDENDLFEIGNPEMDAFFSYESNNESKSQDYYLLIDQPLAEIKEFSSPGFGISKDQINQFYEKLGEFARSKSARLKIKLHPYSYKSDFLLQHSSIEYIKDTDVVKLIMESQGVFAIESTLTLPAVYFKKCCLFKVWEDSSFQNRIKALKLAQVLDYRSFRTEDIDFETIKKSQENIEIFSKEYFYKMDGKAVQRLKELLNKK